MNSSSGSSSLSDNEYDITNYLVNDAESIDKEIQGAIVSHIHTRNMMMHAYINQQVNKGTRRGSITGHVVIHRDREIADRNLFNDYFSENPRFHEGYFLRRFRMSRNLFLRIVDAVKNHDSYFIQRSDGLGRLGLSTNQKTTATIRLLAYGLPADAADEYIKIGESIVIKFLQHFCRAVVEVFANQYLRSPNANDVAQLLYIGKQRGFPGMLGSLYCMHWKWKNCPTAWAGQYTGRSGSPTIILEAVADYDLWIWHAYFGLPSSNNDINVLEASTLFSDLAQGIGPPAHYTNCGKEYDTSYYLADGIYPTWSTIVQTIRDPLGPKKRYFAMKQESCRKDVERAFGVLQSRFAIVASPAQSWRKNDLHYLMKACIIMLNMIIEDERDLSAPIQDAMEAPTPDVEMVVNEENARFQEFLVRYKQIKNRDAHYELRNALIEHLWEQYSSSNI